MKSIKIFILIPFFLLSLKCFAQDGYSINIDVNKAKGKLLTLSYFNGTISQRSQIDSVLITADKQMVAFSNTKKIIGAIYQLNLKDEPKNTINVAIDNGAKLNFTLDGTNLSLLKPSDNLNKDFILFQTATTTVDDKKIRLQQLIKSYPNSITALFAKLELKKLDANFAHTYSSTERKTRDAYFNGIDLQDKRIALLPNAYSFLYEYMSLLPVTNENYQDNVDLLFKGADCNSKNYIFYLDWVFKNLTYYQRYNLSNTYRYVYSMYLDKDICKSRDDKFYNKTTESLKKLNELPIGTVIPDFKMEDSVGKMYDIKSIYSKGDYTFLSFYDPDCSHCQEMMPKVASYFEANKQSSKQVQKIAFINSKDIAKWQAFIQEYKLTDWLNVKTVKDDMKYMNDLKVFTNPQFFLLDEKGTILLKTFNVDELNAILKK
jgi:thiol-disulfide isomerase/thioredoxin